MASTDSTDVRISVRNLWKVFGHDANDLLDQEWAQEASKKEIQERTGNVIAMRDILFLTST